MSDSDSDAPEAIKLSHSARAARGHAQTLQEIAFTERRKTKERNRARDERLKAQAAEKREKIRPTGNRRKFEDVGKEESDQDPESRRLEARMARAMAEAGDEDDSQTESERDSATSREDEFDEFSGQDSSAEDDVDLMDEDAGEEDEAVVGNDSVPVPVASRNYLPDHVFATAAAAAAVSPKRSKLSTQEPLSSDSRLQRKRKRATNRAKDVVIGSHAVRTLPVVHRTSAKTSLSCTPASGATTAPARITRFLSKSLALKGQKQRGGQSWERRPVNLGLFRRNEGAPVTGFVRSP